MGRVTIRPRRSFKDRVKGFAYRAGKTFSRAKNLYGRVRGNVPKSYRDKLDTAFATGEAIFGVAGSVAGTDFTHSLGNESNSLKLKGSATTVDAPGDVTKTSYVFKRKSKPMAAAISATAMRGIYLTKSRYAINSNIGQQNSADMTAGLTSINLTQGSIAPFMGATGDSSSSPATYFPSIYQVLGTQISGSDVTNQSTFNTLGTTRLYISKCTVETQITNATNAPVVVKIYELICKADMSGTVIIQNTSGAQSLYGSYVYSPVQYWIRGLANLLPAIASSSSGAAYPNMTSQTYGSSPTNSPLFNSYWQVLATHQVTLGMGSSHIHMSKYDVNQYCEEQREQYSGILAGRTRQIMITVNGVVADSTAVQTGVANLTKAEVVVHHNMKYNYSAVPYNRIITGWTDGGLVVTNTNTYDQDGDINVTSTLP